MNKKITRNAYFIFHLSILANTLWVRRYRLYLGASPTLRSHTNSSNLELLTGIHSSKSHGLKTRDNIKKKDEKKKQPIFFLSSRVCE